MLQVTDEDRKLYEILTEGFEEEGGYQTDQRGGQSLRYITGEQCISRLNKAFGVLGWTFEIRERWYDEAADECCVLGRLTVYRKISLIEQVPGYEEGGSVYREVLKEISHEQIGSQKHNRRRTVIITEEAYNNLRNESGRPIKELLYTRQEDGWYRKNDSDAILDTGFDWKGAGTDALKKCASWFGIALELSRKGGSRTATQRPQNQQSRPQGGQNQQQRPQSQGAPSRPSTAAQGANGTTGGKSFIPPFQSQRVTEELACVAAHCGIVMIPKETYEVEANGQVVAQTTEYIVKRSKEEAFGKVLCLKHVMEWIAAKREQGIPLASDPAKTTAA